MVLSPSINACIRTSVLELSLIVPMNTPCSIPEMLKLTHFFLRTIVCYIGSRGWSLVEADAMAAHISIPKAFASGDVTEWFKWFEIINGTTQQRLSSCRHYLKGKRLQFGSDSVSLEEFHR